MRKRKTRQMVFRIELIGSADPVIWRKLSVPDSLTFKEFHYIIQEAFGWWNCHLHEFMRFDENVPEEDYDIEVPQLWIKPIFENEEDPFDGAIEPLSEDEITLAKVFTKKEPKLVYVYDMGDNWCHSIVLEQIIDTVDGEETSIEVTDGRGICPPEDCGGIDGFTHVKQVMAQPMHEEFQEYVNWLPQGRHFNANDCSLQEINIRISKMLRMGVED